MKIKGKLEIVDDNERPLIELGVSHGRPYGIMRNPRGKLLGWVTVDADGKFNVRDCSRSKKNEQTLSNFCRRAIRIPSRSW